MPLESATTISGLVATNPPGTDDREEGDDHIRLIKSVLRGLIPCVLGVAAPVNLTIASGAITPTSATLRVMAEGGLANSDVLDTINTTGTHDGAFIMVRLQSGHTGIVTVRDKLSGTGRISLDDEIDHILRSSNDIIILRRDGGVWREVNRKPHRIQLEEYSAHSPVGICRIFSTTTNANDSVPAYLKPPKGPVVWSLISDSGRYLRINDSAPFDIGGDSSVPLPEHEHGAGTLQVQTGTRTVADGSASATPANQTYQVTGETGGVTGTNPPIDIKPLFRNVRLWQRTA